MSQMPNNPPEEGTIDLLAIIKMLWKHAVLIIACALVVGVGAFVFAKVTMKPVYTSTGSLYVINQSSSSGSTISQSQLNASAMLVDTYSVILKSNSTLSKVIEQLDLNITPSQLSDKITISAINGTEIFKVSVQAYTPEEATSILTVLMECAPVQIRDVISPKSDANDMVRPVDPASVPTGSSGPNYMKYGVFGILLGGLLCCCVLIVRDYMDTTMKSEADFTRFPYPVLGVIPDLNQSGGKVYGTYQHARKGGTHNG